MRLIWVLLLASVALAFLIGNLQSIPVLNVTFPAPLAPSSNDVTLEGSKSFLDKDAFVQCHWYSGRKSRGRPRSWSSGNGGPLPDGLMYTWNGDMLVVCQAAYWGKNETLSAI